MQITYMCARRAQRTCASRSLHRCVCIVNYICLNTSSSNEMCFHKSSPVRLYCKLHVFGYIELKQNVLWKVFLVAFALQITYMCARRTQRKCASRSLHRCVCIVISECLSTSSSKQMCFHKSSSVRLYC